MTSLIRIKNLICASRICHTSLQSINNGNTILYEQVRLAGHAKWQNIKNTKEANDLAKGKLISRYVLMVRKAIVTNNMQTDPKINTKLGDILMEAGKFNVPKATLERAIARASNIKIYPVNIEAKGPDGCTLIIRCETDSVSVLKRDIKKALRKFEVSLMPDNTLINMFGSQGFIRTAKITTDGREINQEFAEEAAIISNAEEVYEETYDGAEDESLSKVWVFKTDVGSLNPCKGELEKQGFKVLSHDLDLVPYRFIDFGPETYGKVVEIQKTLGEMEQVVDVYHNVASPEDKC